MERKHNSFRHTFEHVMLRNYYMKSPKEFVEVMLRDENVLFRMYDEVCRDRGEENPYQPEQFGVNETIAQNGAKAIKLTMPTPEDQTECYRIYAFYNEGNMNPGYFTIEKCGDDAHQDSFVCRWLKLPDRPLMHMILDEPGKKDEFEHVSAFYGSYTVSELYQMFDKAKEKARPLSEEEAKRFRKALSA